jgi:hypothetical protein
MSSHTRTTRFSLCALAYLGLSLGWIYGVLDRGRLEESDAALWAVLAVASAAHVAFGYFSREWPALLLPIVVLVLAIPAGYPVSRYGEPSPTWLGQLVLIPAEVVLIAAGLGLRALVDSRRPGLARPRSS